MGDEDEARQRRDHATTLDEGDERLAQRTGQLKLTQPKCDPSPADLGTEQASELGVTAECAMFSNS